MNLQVLAILFIAFIHFSTSSADEFSIERFDVFLIEEGNREHSNLWKGKPLFSDFFNEIPIQRSKILAFNDRLTALYLHILLLVLGILY